jgi:ATP-dependent DNA helicase 2 subunit 2
MPFAEDERSFFFPSLNDLYSKYGKQITEHPLLPTDNQLLLMDKLVEGMDLDVYEEVEDE